jgi:hypothetical protein
MLACQFLCLTATFPMSVYTCLSRSKKKGYALKAASDTTLELYYATLGGRRAKEDEIP